MNRPRIVPASPSRRRLPLRSGLPGAAPSLAVLFALGTIFLAAPATAREGGIVVQSVNYPLHYFAQRLATEAFDLRYVVDEDEDPAFWMPDDEALLAFQQADVILRNGADYARWMKTVTLPTTTMVDTSRGFAAEFIEVEGEAHQHGDGPAHSHAGTAYTTWIDFSQAAMQAEAVAERFQELSPGDSEAIAANLAALKEDLEDLHERMAAFGEAWGERPLVASHPVYHYFARAYGLAIESLDWEPDMDLTPEALEELRNLVTDHPAEWMIWEDEPAAELVEGIAAIGVKSAVFAPCENTPEEGDWLEVMQRNVAAMEAMLGPEG